MIQVKFKKLSDNAVVPKQAYPGDAAFDLVATSFDLNESGTVVIVGTGLSVAIPDGYEGQIRSRSGLASKGMFVTNGVGTIDSGYRGEIKVLVSCVNATPHLFEFKRGLKAGGAEVRIGDRIAQLAIREVSKVEVLEVDDLDSTDRGAGGIGSSGLSSVKSKKTAKETQDD